MTKRTIKKAAPKTRGKAKAPAKPKPLHPPGAEQLYQPPAGLRVIALERIDPSPYNPRRAIEPGELKGLAASIREHGLLQPLVVRLMSGPGGAGDRYELIAGHRRLAALQSIGVAEAPCVVRAIDSTATVRALQIIENLQRSDIPPMEEARAFVALQDEDPARWTTAAIAATIGKSDRFVAQRLGLARNLLPARATWEAKTEKPKGAGSGRFYSGPANYARADVELSAEQKRQQEELETFNGALADRLQQRPDLTRRLILYEFIASAGGTCMSYDEDPCEPLEPWREQLAAAGVDVDDDMDDQYQPHTVAGVGCTAQVPPAMWGCRAHWYALPADLRAAIWRTYRPGQEDTLTPSAEYLAAARAVQAWIAKREGASNG